MKLSDELMTLPLLSLRHVSAAKQLEEIADMLAEQMKATAHQAVETEKKYGAHVAVLTARVQKLRAERDELSRQLLEVRNPLSSRAARVVIRFL